MLSDIKTMQRKSCIEDVEKGYELTKEKHPEEVDYFNQFEESCWKGFKKNWLSSHLDSGVPRTNDACERHNRCFNDNFTFRKLAKPSDFLQNLKNGVKVKVTIIQDSTLRHQWIMYDAKKW